MGVLWAIAAYAGNKIITVLTTVILARILVPSDFGLLALATLTVGILGVARDLGLGATLIVRQELDDRAKGTILTLMTLGGLVVAVAAALLSPVAAAAFREPRLGPVLVALSAVIVLWNIGWFYEAILQRELAFQRRFVAQIVLAVTNAAVAVPLALAGAGVWSLVVGQVVSGVLWLATLVTLAPYRVRPTFDRRIAIDAFRTGRGFLAQGGIAFVQHNLDYVAVGRFLGPTALGFYSMAYRLGELPYLAIADPVAKVTFPDFAQKRHRGEDITEGFLVTLRLIALTTVPLGILLSGAATPFVEVVLGDKWTPMIATLAVFGLWAAVQPALATVSWVLNSIGDAGVLAKATGIITVPLLAGVVFAATLGTVEAVAWAVLAQVACSLPIIAWLVSWRAGIPLRRQLRAVAPVYVAALPAWGMARLVATTLAGTAPVLALLASAAAGLVAYLLTLAVVEPGVLGRTAAQVQSALGQMRRPAVTPT